MGFVLQRDNLIPSLTLRENVAAPLMLAGRSRAKAFARADEMLAAVGLTHRANAWPADVSGGEAQRTAVARACAGEPDVVFADEPTGALDSHAGEIVLDLLVNLARELTAIAILVTHDLTAARRAERWRHPPRWQTLQPCASN